jgi:hypothetical protein
MNVNTLIRAALNCCKCNDAKWRIEDISFYDGYAERGYTNPESGIIATGNWNTVSYVEDGEVKDDETLCRLERLLNKMGVSCEWSDEWIACSECNKLVRTSPDCHDWTASYEIVNDCEILCSNCIDPVEYLSDLEGGWKRCNHFSHINPTDYGYKRLPKTFEHGLHHGQDASPEKIAKALRSKGISRFVFSLEEKSQFDVYFGVFVAEEEFDEMLLDGEETDGPSPSDACMKALQGLSSSEK